MSAIFFGKYIKMKFNKIYGKIEKSIDCSGDDRIKVKITVDNREFRNKLKMQFDGTIEG